MSLRTNAPSVSDEHLIELGKMSGVIPAYRTRELVDAIVGYARVVLSDPAVQEAFLRANPSPDVAAQIAKLEVERDELVVVVVKAVRLNSFREFNDHIPAMKAALAKVGADKTGEY